LAVVEAWTASGEAPADLADARLAPEPTAISGRFVQSVTIADGQVVIRYGGQSQARLAGRVLVLTPYTDNQNGNVMWICGNAPPPPGAVPIGGTAAGPTSLEDKYLPTGCRSGFSSGPAAPAGMPMAAASAIGG
jgi:type IV pilus assembly protein PilA